MGNPDVRQRSDTIKRGLSVLVLIFVFSIGPVYLQPINMGDGIRNIFILLTMVLSVFISRRLGLDNLLSIILGAISTSVVSTAIGVLVFAVIGGFMSMLVILKYSVSLFLLGIPSALVTTLFLVVNQILLPRSESPSESNPPSTTTE